MSYIVYAAAGALLASLWWLRRMYSAMATWQLIADAYRRSIDDADRMLAQNTAQIVRLIGQLRATGHPGYQDPEFANGRRQKGVRP